MASGRDRDAPAPVTDSGIGWVSRHVRRWNVVVTGLPRYARYAEKAGRDLPVVILEPR